MVSRRSLWSNSCFYACVLQSQTNFNISFSDFQNLECRSLHTLIFILFSSISFLRFNTDFQTNILTIKCTLLVTNYDHTEPRSWVLNVVSWTNAFWFIVHMSYFIVPIQRTKTSHRYCIGSPYMSKTYSNTFTHVELLSSVYQHITNLSDLYFLHIFEPWYVYLVIFCNRPWYWMTRLFSKVQSLTLLRDQADTSNVPYDFLCMISQKNFSYFPIRGLIYCLCSAWFFSFSKMFRVLLYIIVLISFDRFGAFSVIFCLIFERMKFMCWIVILINDFIKFDVREPTNYAAPNMTYDFQLITR